MDNENQPAAVEAAPIKKRVGRPPKRPKLMQHDGKRVMFPTAPLDVGSVEVRDVALRVNQLEKVILVQHEALTHYRDMFKVVRSKKEINLDVLQVLAAEGNSKKRISTLLGFAYSLWKERPELNELYDQGLAAFEGTILRTQVNAALNGSEKLMVHLGKNYLGQTDSPLIEIHNTANEGGTTTVGIKDKMMEAKRKNAAAKQAFEQLENVIDAEIISTESDAA